jgi:hypothetical protein
VANDQFDDRAWKQGAAANPVLERLDALAGEWRVEGVHSLMKDTVVHGRVRFEWLAGGHFLVQQSEMDHPDFPSSIAIIGLDDSGEHCTMQYFDSRGISRMYQMGLSDGVWTIWRDAPDFSQRFTGRFSDDCNSITAYWDLSRDSETWGRDIDLTYLKVG